jgi:ribosomal-protein-alanine N-acetyltransferase
MHLEPIETRRLAIRQFRPDDWKAVYEYMSDPKVVAYLPEGRLTEAQTREFLAENTGEHAKALAVTLKADEALIGHMVFHPWFAPQTYEIGWVFSRRYHGHGYATEAAYALLEHGFEGLQLHRVIATCQPENVPSYRVMEKLGMRCEGHFQKCIYRGENRWWDEYFYAMLEEEWFGGKVERRWAGKGNER